MSYKCKILLMMACVIYSNFMYSQLKYSTKINSSSTTVSGEENQFTVQGNNNIFVTYKRGEGTSSLDRQIKVARSTNKGVSFSEVDITHPLNTDTYSPSISSTSTSIIAMYSMLDNTGTEKVCIARSTNSGSTYTLTLDDRINLFNTLNGYRSFVSDGSIKYALTDGSVLFISIDNGLTFQEKSLPPISSWGYNSQLAIEGNNLWLTINREDSIYIYRSTNNGDSYQLITKFFADTPNDFNHYVGIEAFSNSLFVAWEEESVGVFYLRSRTITGTTVGVVKQISSSSTELGYPIEALKTNGTIWVWGRRKNLLFRSLDLGNTWSRGSEINIELSGFQLTQPPIAFNDTTIYLYSDRYSSGSLIDKIFANVKWTDAPISALPNDTTISNSSYIYFQFLPYVATDQYKFQISKYPNFIPVTIDTIMNYESFIINMDNRFEGNQTTYYYRVRGFEGNYQTSWSPIKSFKYGIIISQIPALHSPAQGENIYWPQFVQFGWTIISAPNYTLHISTNNSFTDSVFFYNYLTQPFYTYLPPNSATYYWRVRGSQYTSNSFGPWSETRHFNYSNTTSIDENINQLPKDFFLFDNFPNPFNPSTKIKYQLPQSEFVNIKVFDIPGNEIETLVNKEKPAGFYEVDFNASDLPSGVYIYRMQAGDYVQTRKMLLLK